MFGFSIPKLLVLVAIIAVVWYGFKAVGRLKAAQDAKAVDDDRDDKDDKDDATIDLERNPDTGDFEPRRDRDRDSRD